VKIAFLFPTLEVLSSLMADTNEKPEFPEKDPDTLARLLELELIQKRAIWQQTAARRSKLKALSFFFLFLVVVGAFLAFFFFFSQISERHPNQPPAATPATARP
jgi:hypothetical protein